MKKTIMALLFGMLLAATSAHASDQSRYEALVLKYATKDFAIGKTACICTGGFKVGWVRLTALDADGAVEVECGIPTFKPDGSLDGLNFCTTFSVLAK